MKAPACHLVGDFVAYAIEPCMYILDFLGQPHFRYTYSYQAMGSDFWLTKYDCFGYMFCEVILGTHFSWVASKMTLSSTKLYAK